MSVKSWLADKSKRRQLENIQGACANVFSQLTTGQQFVPLDQLARVAEQRYVEYVEILATEAALGLLKGIEVWPAFALSAEAADFALPPELAAVAKRIIRAGYRRAREKWHLSAAETDAEIARAWKLYTTLTTGVEPSEADVGKLLTRFPFSQVYLTHD